MAIYSGDKNVRICFRCDDKLAEWVVGQAGIVGITPSAYVRQTLYGLMASHQRLSDVVMKTVAQEARDIISSEKAVTADEHDSRNQ